VRFYKETHVCAIHYRAKQMRYDAQASGKIVPTEAVVLSLLTAAVAAGMKCPHCSRPMNWFRDQGHSTIITLQHNRDGTFRIVCLGCNVRHQFQPGDSFFDVPAGSRFCKGCSTVKPLGDFYTFKKPDSDYRYVRTVCKQCDVKQAVIDIRRRRKEAKNANR
jgi:RNase P subunit RPR2